MRRLEWALVAGLALIGAAAPAAIADSGTQPANREWPVYGANLANTRTAPGGPTPAQAASLHAAWSDTFYDGDFTGTPVVFGGVVFVGSNGGVVRAIEAVSGGSVKPGTVLWSAKVPGPVNGSLAVAPPDPASELSGTDDPATVFVPVARQGSPELVALNAATGAQRWATVLDTSTDADVFGSPVPVDVDGRDVVLQGVSATSGDPPSPLRGSLSALDSESGAVIWKTYTVPPGDNGGAVWSTPAVDTAAGVVYAGTGNAYTGAAAPTTDAIVKFDLHTGAILGWFQGTSGDVFSSSNPGFDFDFGASPNLMNAGGKSLVGEGQKSGTYWAVDTSSMKPVWSATLGAGSAAGGVLGSTAFDSATGQITGPLTLPGYIWSISASSGQLRWLSPGGVDPVQWSPVSVSNGVAYSVASTGFVEAWNEATGVPITAVALNPIPPSGSYTIGLGSGVAIADGLVIADLGSAQSSQGIVAAFSG